MCGAIGGRGSAKAKQPGISRDTRLRMV
jgi:hypothetical protein